MTPKRRKRALYIVAHLYKWRDVDYATADRHGSLGFCVVYEDYEEALKHAGGDERKLVKVEVVK